MATTHEMTLELHLLQSFAPSNLNRDLAGNPKDCTFGGVRRARISSQCLKRAARTHPTFAEGVAVELGWRTRYASTLLAPALLAAGFSSTEAGQALAQFIPVYFGKLADDKKRPGQSATAVFTTSAEVAALAEAIVGQRELLLAEKPDAKRLDKLASELVKAHAHWTSAPDVALFGRMVAEHPDLNLEAACSVAHAIATHRTAFEEDAFTAIDDLLEGNRAGEAPTQNVFLTEEAEGNGGTASMLGSSPFTSATFYRLAVVNIPLLVSNLHDDQALALKTIGAFIQSTLVATPTGKQTAFAAFCPPVLGLGVLRANNQPRSLVNAFEQPIPPSPAGGFVGRSTRALLNYFADQCQFWGEDDLRYVGILDMRPTLGRDTAVELTTAHTHYLDSVTAWTQGLVDAVASTLEA